MASDNQDQSSVVGAVPGSNPNQVPNIMPPPAQTPQLANQNMPPANPQGNPSVRPAIDPAAAADVAHHAAIGKAFRSIMGNDVNYQVDPNTGQMSQVSTPQKPGTLWRSMLASVILGGATAARDKAPGFVQGAAEGGGAVIADNERRDGVKREQARQQAKDIQSTRAANTEEDLKHAQIAFHNSATLKENQDMQFAYSKHEKEEAEYKVRWPIENLRLHNDAASLGTTQIKPFIDAGLPYAFKDVSESEHNDLLKNNPNAIHLLWEPTGVKMSVDSKGDPTYEGTYSAVDPKGDVKLTSDWITAGKKAGLDQVYGTSTWDVLTKGKTLDAKTYMAANQKLQELTNAKTVKDKQKFDEDKERATINNLRAETADRYADARLKNAKAEGDSNTDSGLTKLSSNGGNLAISKLNLKEKTALLKFYTNELNGARGVYAAAVQNGQQTEAKQQYQTILGIQSILGQFGNEAAGKLSQNIDPTKAPKLPAPVVEKLTDYGEVMKQEGIESGTLDAYDYLSKQPVSKDNPVAQQARDEAIKKFAVVPWSAVVDRASREGVTRDKAAQQFKSEGYKIEYDSDKDKETQRMQLQLQMQENEQPN